MAIRIYYRPYLYKGMPSADPLIVTVKYNPVAVDSVGVVEFVVCIKSV